MEKVEKTITRGMDMVFDKGVKYIRDYERSNLPPEEKKMLSNFFDDYYLLKKRFQKINKLFSNERFIKVIRLKNILLESKVGHLVENQKE